MRSSNPFTRFAHMFTGYEYFENSSSFNVPTAHAEMLTSGNKHDLIVDSFIFVQVQTSVLMGTDPSSGFFDLRNTNGTAGMHFLEAGRFYRVIFNREPISTQWRNDFFLYRCATAGTFEITWWGGITATAQVGPGSLRTEIYIFK